MGFYDRFMGFRDGTYIVTIKPYGRFKRSRPMMRENKRLLCWEYRYNVIAPGAVMVHWFPSSELEIANRGKAIMVKKGDDIKFY